VTCPVTAVEAIRMRIQHRLTRGEIVATCGSDPKSMWRRIRRQAGTRRKLSPVDFETSLTFSIVLVASSFAEPDWQGDSCKIARPCLAPLVLGAGACAVSIWHV